MKIALSIWNERIAPVFDVSSRISLIEVDGERVTWKSAEELPGAASFAAAAWLAEQGVETLICGAVSRPVLARLTGYGIRVIPFVAGGRREVVEAWLNGTLERKPFLMPGCRRGGPGPGRRGCRGRGHGGMASGCLWQETAAARIRTKEFKPSQKGG
ncbi:MAG TPA: NifB/NifX family molybdenum-iron cluster-binding protein [bacterium]|nr:NifB/NifX family molybdenum-iron cluster-binding protein [bacterium]HNS48988.1 NifB/NifX family molybdenum-iron cluster-binding protein [bacterium]